MVLTEIPILSRLALSNKVPYPNGRSYYVRPLKEKIECKRNMTISLKTDELAYNKRPRTSKVGDVVLK